MARIRSIKPEFWQSEKLAGISEHARLLAIALLNHADDEGYFMANVALVRAACFPFDDDSSKCRRSLGDLSALGFITIVEASGKQIGHVVNFLEHQRIDRPKKSTLKDAFNDALSTKARVLLEKNDIDEQSSNSRRLITDNSLLEQGTGNREMEVEQGRGTGNVESETAAPSEAVASLRPFSRSVMEVLEVWNFSMNQKCQMTEKRQKIVKQRLKDVLWVAGWREGVVKAVASDFCQGHNDRNWVADFEWFIRPDSVTKLLEGKFDNRGSAGKPASKPIKASESPEYAGLARL